MKKTEFDDFATDYYAALSKWVALTGETTEFYARSRVGVTAKWLHKLNFPIHNILDFGCGIGTAIPFFQEFFGSQASITGTDISLSSLEIGRAQHSAPNVLFLPADNLDAVNHYDLVYCNGVFHHIPLSDRAREVRRIYNALRPGGWLAFWENNPWHPIVNYNMSHADIDRNAVPISPIEAKKMLTSSAFSLRSIRFYFVFPSFLSVLRRFENILSLFPMGAQYMILCQKD